MLQAMTRRRLPMTLAQPPLPTILAKPPRLSVSGETQVEAKPHQSVLKRRRLGISQQTRPKLLWNDSVKCGTNATFGYGLASISSAFANDEDDEEDTEIISESWNDTADCF